MDLDARKAIKAIIAVCDESIESDRLERFFFEPIGRSDTFMIRNTLQSILNLTPQVAPEGSIGSTE